MGDEDRQEPEIRVSLFGSEVRLFFPAEGWTFEEALLAKTASDGMAPAEVEERLWLGDPHAWMALLRVSFKRAGLRIDADRLAKVPILEIAEKVLEQLRQVPDPSPEASPSSDPDSELNGTGSSEALSSETTPESSGIPDSPPSSTVAGTPRT